MPPAPFLLRLVKPCHMFKKTVCQTYLVNDEMSFITFASVFIASVLVESINEWQRDIQSCSRTQLGYEVDNFVCLILAVVPVDQQRLRRICDFDIVSLLVVIDVGKFITISFLAVSSLDRNLTRKTLCGVMFHTTPSTL
jgi:hypothetical protein